MRRVLLGTPTLSGSVTAQFLFSYSQTLKACLTNKNVRGEADPIDLCPLLPIHDSVIQHARNKIVASAIEHDFDDLVFVDADEDWTAEDFLRLLSHPVHSVGAPVRKKDEERELYNVRSRIVAQQGASAFTFEPTTGLISAPDMALGTGFLRLSRLALQTLWASSKPYTVWSDADEYRWIFDITVQDGELVSEDNIVCDKLRAAGIPTWLDAGIVVGHHGPKRYAGEFKAWLAQHMALPTNPHPGLGPNTPANVVAMKTPTRELQVQPAL
jgi:hypothetical protein